MNTPKEPSDTCQIPERDAREHADLCCCYVLDEAESLQDPCEIPVDECCCC